MTTITHTTLIAIILINNLRGSQVPIIYTSTMWNVIIIFSLLVVGPFETIRPTLYGVRNGAQTLRISTMLFICTALAVMLILPLRRLL